MVHKFIQPQDARTYLLGKYLEDDLFQHRETALAGCRFRVRITQYWQSLVTNIEQNLHDIGKGQLHITTGENERGGHASAYFRDLRFRY